MQSRNLQRTLRYQSDITTKLPADRKPSRHYCIGGSRQTRSRIMGKTNRKTPHGSRSTDGAHASSRNQRAPGPVPREVQVSKKLSFLLRHGAGKQGLKLGPGGYVNVADLLANQMIKSAHVTFDEIRTVVDNNEKKRFGLAYIAEHSPKKDSTEKEVVEGNVASDASAATAKLPSTENAVANEDQDPAHYLIRANQGHSIKLEDTADLLTPISIEADNLPSIVVHGTRHQAWSTILETGGLKPMGRNHVHFATGVPEQLRFTKDQNRDQEFPQLLPGTPDNVASLSLEEPKSPDIVSGMRVSSTILIFLDLRKALEEGLKFFRSENGVVLTEGDQDGVVLVGLFERVEAKGGQILVEHGKVVSELKGYAESAAKGKKSAKPKLNTKDQVVDHENDELESE